MQYNHLLNFISKSIGPKWQVLLVHERVVGFVVCIVKVATILN